MRRFKVNLPAGQMVSLSVRGDYVRVIMSDGELKIEPNNSQSLQGMTKGMAYTAPVTFNELKLTSDIDQQVELMAGVGKIEDNRATINGTIDVAGVVNVVNDDKTRTENLIAFMNGWEKDSSLSKYARVILFNPVLSGVNLVINQILMSTPDTGRAYRISKTSDYALLESEVGFSVASTANCKSKMLNGPLSKAEIKITESDSSVYATEDGIFTLDVKANEPLRIKFTEPYIVEPGGALMVVDRVVEGMLRASFEWFEESI